MMNNYPFRGVLSNGMPGQLGPNYGPRTMSGGALGSVKKPIGEMNFGQFGVGNAFPFQAFLPQNVGVAGFGQPPNLPGVLSGGFRRGF